MRYAIELTLDDRTTRMLRQIKRRLAASHMPAPPGGAADPHVSLGVCERLDLARCRAMLSDLAWNRPLPVRFESLGIFATEGAVLIAAPVVTRDLLGLHEAFHDRFHSVASGQSAYYLPGRWVPHCTLAERIPRGAIPDAVRTALDLPLPITGRFEGLRILDIPNGRILHHVA